MSINVITFDGFDVYPTDDITDEQLEVIWDDVNRIHEEWEYLYVDIVTGVTGMTGKTLRIVLQGGM